MHDFTIFKQIFSGFDFSKMKVYVDLGFLGIKKIIKYNELYIPHKNTKLRPLTDSQKEENRQQASTRVKVENAIAKVKTYFILRIKNRMKKIQTLHDAFNICTLLANFKSNHLIFNS